MRPAIALSVSTLLLAGGAVRAASPSDDDRTSGTRQGTGPVVRLAEDTVIYRHTDAYRVRLTGGERTHLLVRGSGELNLVVRNGAGEVIAADLEDDRLSVVRFTPRYSGVFSVQVVNRSDQDVDYRLTAE